MKTKIHIWDLPIEKVYVKLRGGFREHFFEAAHQKFGTWDRLAKFLEVKRGDTLLARNWKNGLCCCPLSIIFEISNKLDISKNKIEKNIKEIKFKTKKEGRGGNSGKPIINPKLPIEINKDFIEVLGHICGDGTIIRKNPKKGIKLGYINSEPKLIESFQEKIKRIFGEIEANVQIRNGPRYRRKNYYLQYPSIISLFILSVFDYKTKDNMDLPDFIFNASKERKCAFLRALFDDEGSVSVRHKAITINLKPYNPLKKVRELLIELGFNPSRIIESGRVNRIGIHRKDDILLFKKIIGFKYPLKEEKLDLIIKNGWKFNANPKGVSKQKIISFLGEKKQAKTQEIVDFLGRRPVTARVHLRNLRKEGLILNKKVKRFDVWRLNE
ncbi:MAG TPA: LAGLIDADG family homing endonuclease [Candidatus Paceibacterota bacterium]|nr:LAGLIDADG family homing endonuclease [Candidatus Paceibacterota bacterium]